MHFNPQLFKVSIIQTKLFGPLDFELSRFHCSSFWIGFHVLRNPSYIKDLESTVCPGLPIWKFWVNTCILCKAIMMTMIRLLRTAWSPGIPKMHYLRKGCLYHKATKTHISSYMQSNWGLLFLTYRPESSCLKLTMSLVNVTLKLWSLNMAYGLIFLLKKIWVAFAFIFFQQKYLWIRYCTY